jgi:2,4'-dihydroxyacetophenone dioxygenase
LVTEGEEDVITLFMLGGTLQFFDEENNIIAQDDVFTIYKRYRDFCATNGFPIREDLVY